MGQLFPHRAPLQQWGMLFPHRNLLSHWYVCFLVDFHCSSGTVVSSYSSLSAVGQLFLHLSLFHRWNSCFFTDICPSSWTVVSSRSSLPKLNRPCSVRVTLLDPSGVMKLRAIVTVGLMDAFTSVPAFRWVRCLVFTSIPVWVWPHSVAQKSEINLVCLPS